MTIVTSLKATIVAGAALAALASTALAADIIEPRVIAAPVIEKVQPFSGWYIRGDVGLSFNRAREETKIPFFQPGNFGPNGATIIPAGADPFTATGVRDPALDILIGKSKADYDNGILVGVGVGAQLNQFLRADITADYMFNSDVTVALDGNGKFTSASGGSVPCSAPGCDASMVGDIEALTVLANAYVDFGTYSGITPYVGAGIGFAHVDYGDITLKGCEVPLATEAGATSCPGAATRVQTSKSFDGDGTLRLAWSLAAGASYDVSHNVALDAGYRFVRVREGEVHTDPLAGKIKDGGLDMHQVRVGARMKLH